MRSTAELFMHMAVQAVMPQGLEAVQASLVL